MQKLLYTARFNDGECDVQERFDVAIVKVDRPFVWDENVQPACLPTEDFQVEDGTEFSVVGNGYVDYDTQAVAATLQVQRGLIMEQKP